MPRPDERRTAARNYIPESRLEDLAIRLRRLANHRGLVRSEIASPMLLRLLPGPMRGEARIYESDLRRKIQDANLDAERIAYLMNHVEQEIDIAHARSAG